MPEFALVTGRLGAYREVGTDRFCLFYSVGGGDTTPGVAVASGSDEALSISWLRGLRRGLLLAERLMAHKTVFWLTPERFFAGGGVYAPATDVAPGVAARLSYPLQTSDGD